MPADFWTLRRRREMDRRTAMKKTNTISLSWTIRREELGRLGTPDRGDDGETSAARAQEYVRRARAERVAASGAGLSVVERVEQRLAQILNPPRAADGFESNIKFTSRYRWGRLKQGKGEAKVGQLALVESGRAVLVLLPRKEQSWTLARLVVSAESCLDKVLSSEPPPLQEELGLLAIGVSSRAVVKWPDSAHHDKSGFVLAEDEQKGEARVRVSVRGEAVRTWHPRLLETLKNGSPEEVEDTLVPRWTLRRHLLSVSDELRALDRVRVLGGLSAGVVGRVHAVDRSEHDPEVMMWVVEGGEREIKVTMTEVRREFMLGDLVQVVAEPSVGKRGIVVGRAEAGALDIYTGVSADSTQPDLSTATRGAAAQSRRTRVPDDLLTAELQKIKQSLSANSTPAKKIKRGKASKISVAELGVMAAATVGRAAAGELSIAEVEDVTLKAMVCVLEDHVGFEQGREGSPHVMKGRMGMVMDNHWKLDAEGVRTMGLTVRIEVTNALVQVPEEQARHRCTGMPLRRATYLAPWAGPLQLGFTDDEDEWEGRRTPEWEGGTTPMEEAWRPTQGEMATAAVAAAAAAAAARAVTRIGEDEGRWLCIPRLQGKRVDVRVWLKTAGKRVSGAQVAAAGQSGFIELSHALNTPVSARERVVIIGPDEVGERDREGDYAETSPNTEQMGDMVWVKFERVEGVDEQWRKYPVESLCRSLNEDGTFTRKSRF
ncbi:hypothetical protein C8F04DRAFT_1397151 [Mycena alexandri]|uniref:Chromatin elongation factor spt5 n=1 Tax=Mycena alexandri TaxID=1745969 RepID=A0AAD6WY37_9AGAR|nr:hypothetical protein C8F04DRAFT_1397151 [Mycena alexandri]